MAKSVVFSTSSSVRSRAEADTSLSSRAFIDSRIESPRVGGFPPPPPPPVTPSSTAGSTNRSSSPFNVEVETAQASEEGTLGPGRLELGPWYLAEDPRARGDVGPRLNPDNGEKGGERGRRRRRRSGRVW